MVVAFLRRDGLEYDFQIPDAAADGLELVCVDDGCTEHKEPSTAAQGPRHRHRHAAALGRFPGF